MRLKLKLATEPDTLWQMLQRPSVLRQVTPPPLTVHSLEPDGFPEIWELGEHQVALRLWGVVPMGRQVINISRLRLPSQNARVLRDTGRVVSGPLAMLQDWEHTMAVAELPDGRALFRDQLRVAAGLLTPVAWFGLWLVWQLRGRRLARLARQW